MYFDIKKDQELNQANSEKNFQVEDLSSNHGYRTEIPNIILDMGLDSYEGWLYIHLKRIASDKGASYASNKYLAKCCNMSVDKVKKLKKILVEKNLIKTTVRQNEDKSFKPTLIQIIDWWPANYKYFILKKEKNKEKPGVGADKSEGVGADKSEVGAVNIPKEEPYKKELINKREVASEDANFLANYLFEDIKKKNPKQLKPKLATWGAEIETFMRVHKCTKEQVVKVIDWASAHTRPYWIGKFKSPRTLRKGFDDALIEMNITKSKSTSISDTEKKKVEIAHKIYKEFFNRSTDAYVLDAGYLQMEDKSFYDKKIDTHFKKNYDNFVKLLKDRYKIPFYLLNQIAKETKNLN